MLWVLVFGAPPWPLRSLPAVFPVMGIEGWMPSTLELRFPGSGGLCVPERCVVLEAGTVGFGGKQTCLKS